MPMTYLTGSFATAVNNLDMALGGVSNVENKKNILLLHTLCFPRSKMTKWKQILQGIRPVGKAYSEKFNFDLKSF